MRSVWGRVSYCLINTENRLKFRLTEISACRRHLLQVGFLVQRRGPEIYFGFAALDEEAAPPPALFAPSCGAGVLELPPALLLWPALPPDFGSSFE